MRHSRKFTMQPEVQLSQWLEVRAGIEPTYADLQSAASPLCHRTSAGPCLSARRGHRVNPVAAQCQPTL